MPALQDQIREQMAERDVVVTKEEFNQWLSTDKELIDRLDESEIDLSCKSDLFDVLDADLSHSPYVQLMLHVPTLCLEAPSAHVPRRRA